MDDLRIIQLDADADFARVSDLCDRAADYVMLEEGNPPNEAYVHKTLTDAPPVCGPEDIFLRGVERPDGTLAGIATSIRHVYQPGEWYMGLLMLDPAERGTGLGRKVAQHVIAEARADGAPCIRIAVLDANPRGRKFWESLGYCHEKSVQGDDHLRHVLKLDLKETTNAS
ncbi:GNAT family N-acetyltransferase [Litoreibacter janthinus]|uniref:Acetyltransferase (GNAT) family protein n=1 Tax=Litoreibacter janthinus TaxID=670154 RepID=A0A1I6G593_9RHOB|nr:GNAT family N-acetyltransferase [Litoreibacter janthinus]SFR37332.1 Acetyltransferase (GNAT) family protein [Litoreibacter janthinus]